MTDTNATGEAKSMTDADITPSPASSAYRPAEPLKTGGPAGDAPASEGKLAGAATFVKENSAKVRGQAEDKARTLAQDGKDRAAGALTQLSGLLQDAAGQVDDKLGAQYGQYARGAADQVSSFSASLDAKSVDDLIEDARAFVRKSPAVAIGAAAAVGFVVARLLTSGIDQRDKD